MAFAAGETITLDVGYLLPMSFAANSTRRVTDPQRMLEEPKYEKPWHKKVETCMVVFFYYVTETGQSWAGSIEKASFRVNNSLFEYSLRKMPEFVGGNPDDLPPGVDIPDDPALTDHMARTGYVWGMKLGTVYPDFAPAGWKPSRNVSGLVPPVNQELIPSDIVWQFENHKPGLPLSIAYYQLAFPQKPAECDRWVQQVLGKTATKAEILELREIVACFYGVPPQTGSARRFVEQQIWYKPQSKVKESDLDELCQSVLAKLMTMANDRKHGTQ